MAHPPSVHHVAGTHYAVLRHPHVDEFADLITRLASVDAIASRRLEADI
jgi:hypothetical protein